MSGYLRHIELSRHLEEKAKEASRNRQLAEERIGQLQALLGAAKKADVKAAEGEELLGQANGALAAKDYKLALEKTKEGEDKAKAAFLQVAESILESSESILNLLRRTSLDISEFTALLTSARDALEKGNFEEGVDTAKRGWTKLEKTLHEYLSDSFSSVQSRVLAAKAMEKDPAMAEDLLSRAREALGASDYEEALSQTEEALDILGRELDYELEGEQKTVGELLHAGSALQADVAKVETYLGKSRKEREAGSYEKAFNYLKQARLEAERQLKKAIEGGRANLKEPLAEARKLGVDVEPVERTAREALEAAKGEDYGRASELIRQALQDLEAGKFRLVLDTIALSRPKFLQAKERGVDIAECVQIFNRAREALQEGKHKDALYYAQKGNEELDRRVQEFTEAAGRMKALVEEVRALAEEGRRLPQVEGLLQDARAALAVGNLKGWSGHLQRIEGTLEQARRDRCEELLEESSFMVTLSEKLGLSLVEETDAVQECSQLLKSGETARALQQAMDLRVRTEEGVVAHFRERIAEVRSSLPPGEDPEDVAELLLKTETALEVKDYGTAASVVEEARGRVLELGRAFASSILDGLQAAQELATALDLQADGLREAHLVARRAFEAGETRPIVAQVQDLRRLLTRLTQQAFNGVKAQVVEARNQGIEIERQKGLLQQAKEATTRGDLPGGLVHLRDCHAVTEEALTLFQRTRDTMAAAAVLVGEGKKKQLNMARALELLVKGKAAFEAGELEKALDIARTARGEAEKEISVLNVTDRILKAREALELAQALQVDVAPWVNLLARAEKSLGKNDFREAVELAMEVEAQARSGVQNSINARIARAEGLLEKIPVPTPDVPELESTLVEVRALLEDRQFREAAEACRKTLGRAEELVEAYEETARALKRAEDLIPELQSMSVKVAGPEKLLAKAKKAVEDGNLKLARQMADEAVSELEKERSEGIDRTIRSFEASVAKAKKDGISTARAEELLKLARKEFQEGRYEEALATAMQSEAVVERMGLQKEIAENALESARKRILALPTEIPFLKKLLKQAEAAFEGGDYVKSLEAAITAMDELTRVRESWERLETAEDAARKALQVAQAVRVDTAKLQLLLEEATSAAGKGDLDGAKDAYDRLVTEATGAVSTFLTQLHTHARNGRVLCNLLDVEVEGIDGKLSEGFGYLEEDQYVSAHVALSEGMEQVENALRGKVESLLGEARASLEHARKLRADVSAPRAKLREAEKALEQGVFERAVRLAQEATDALKAQEDVHQKFARITYRAESLLKTAKKFGIAVKEAEEALRRALERKDADAQGALREAEQSLSLAEAALESFSPALEAELEMEPAFAGREAEGVLTLRNGSKGLAKDLQVEILGDFRVLGLDAPKAVRGNAEVAVPFRIVFGAAGSVPLMVRTRAKRVIDDHESEWEEVFEIPVEAE